MGYIPRSWSGVIDQISVGAPENAIQGNLWIRDIKIEEGSAQSIREEVDLGSEKKLFKIVLPGLTQKDLVDAALVLQKCVVTDVPAYGFSYPYLAASGPRGHYGDYWWGVDTPGNAEAASWIDWQFARHIFLGLREVQAMNPDGRLDTYPWTPYKGTVGDMNAIPSVFFEKAATMARHSDDPAFRQAVYREMHDFLDWYSSPIKRDATTGLITGSYEELDSGPAGANMPAYQTRAPVGLNVEIAVAARLTADLASDLGKSEDSRRFNELFSDLVKAINDHLWDESAGTYHELDLRTMNFAPRDSSSMFYPLRLGIATGERRQRLINYLTNRSKFGWGKTPVPMVSLESDKRDPEYGFWMMFENEMIVKALEETGNNELAAELNYLMLKRLRDGAYSEVNSITGGASPIGSEDYGLSASAFMTGIVEHLFGIDYDARQSIIEISRGFQLLFTAIGLRSSV